MAKYFAFVTAPQICITRLTVHETLWCNTTIQPPIVSNNVPLFLTLAKPDVSSSFISQSEITNLPSSYSADRSRADYDSSEDVQTDIATINSPHQQQDIREYQMNENPTSSHHLMREGSHTTWDYVISWDRERLVASTAARKTSKYKPIKHQIFYLHFLKKNYLETNVKENRT